MLYEVECTIGEIQFIQESVNGDDLVKACISESVATIDIMESFVESSSSDQHEHLLLSESSNLVKE